MRACMANIVEQDIKKGSQITGGRNVIGYDVLFRFRLQISQALMQKSSYPSYESKYCPQDSDVFTPEDIWSNHEGR